MHYFLHHLLLLSHPSRYIVVILQVQALARVVDIDLETGNQGTRLHN